MPSHGGGGLIRPFRSCGPPRIPPRLPPSTAPLPGPTYAVWEVTLAYDHIPEDAEADAGVSEVDADRVVVGDVDGLPANSGQVN